MKKLLILLFFFTVIRTYSQENNINGFIVKGKDSIEVAFNIDSLTVRSFGKIERLQKKVKYHMPNGEKLTSYPNDIDGFCIRSNGRYFCFDSFNHKNSEGSFAFRLIGNKTDKLTVYQIYGSGFQGVNYNITVGYLVRKENISQYYFPVTVPKQWKAELLKIINDCPEYYKYIDENVKKINFEDDFEKYLIQYRLKCK
jgi:hypothetical protein